MGAVPSSGYREYKVSDGYREDVVAICAVPLGEVVADRKRVRQQSRKERVRHAGQGGPTLELATFHLGSTGSGFTPAMSSRPSTAGTSPRSTGGGGPLVGYKLHREGLIPIVRLDRMLGLGNHMPLLDLAVLVRSGGQAIGILVDALGEAPEVPETDVLALHDMLVSGDVVASGVVTSLGPATAAPGC